MRNYTIVRRKEKHSWDQVPVLYVDNQQWRPKLPIAMQAQICYDDEALYIFMQVVEENIRAEETGRIGSPYKDSCMEFFFCPHNDELKYLNFEFNLNTCMAMGLNRTSVGSIRMLPNMDIISPKAEKTTNGWKLEYKIPHELVRQFFPRYAPESGRYIRANCYKCGHETVNPHYHTWNYVDLPDISFHCPEHFGIMYFE